MRIITFLFQLFLLIVAIFNSSVELDPYFSPANIVRIFTLVNLASNIHQEYVTLQYTPRKFVAYPEQELFYVIKNENNVMDPPTRELLKSQAKKDSDGDTDMNGHTNGDAVNGEEDEDEGMT